MFIFYMILTRLYAIGWSICIYKEFRNIIRNKIVWLVDECFRLYIVTVSTEAEL